MHRSELAAIQGHAEMAWRALAQLITALENGKADAKLMAAVQASGHGQQDAGAGHHRHRRRGQVQR